MDKKLRILAAAVVTESDLSKSSKYQLLNYIKEDATDAQVKALLMDGEIVILDEQQEKEINERFEKHFFQKFLLHEVVGAIGAIYVGILAATAAAIIAKIAYNNAAFIVSKSHRECLKYKGNDRKKCFVKFKVAAAKKELESLKANRGHCKKSKNPEKCFALVDKKIIKAKQKSERIIP